MVRHVYVNYSHKSISLPSPPLFQLLVLLVYWLKFQSPCIEVVRVGLVLTNFLGIYSYFLSPVTLLLPEKKLKTPHVWQLKPFMIWFWLRVPVNSNYQVTFCFHAFYMWLPLRVFLKQHHFSGECLFLPHAPDPMVAASALSLVVNTATKHFPLT